VCEGEAVGGVSTVGTSIGLHSGGVMRLCSVTFLYNRELSFVPIVAVPLGPIIKCTMVCSVPAPSVIFVEYSTVARSNSHIRQNVSNLQGKFGTSISSSNRAMIQYRIIYVGGFFRA
jgi:hypothetical protein